MVNSAIGAFVVILRSDERATWRPSQFGYSLFGCTLNFQFPIIKLVDYQPFLSELENDNNPFATVVIAHLAALNTRSNRNEQKVQKLVLVRRLYEKGFKEQDILNLLAFVDWMLTLPPDLEAEFKLEVQQLEARQRMKYVITPLVSNWENPIAESLSELYFSVFGYKF